MSQPLLSASQIFESRDLKEEVVDVPEWGGSIRLVQMTAADSAQLTRDMATTEGTSNGMYLMLIYSARDAEGNRLFQPDPEPAQTSAPPKWTNAIAQLQGKNFDVLNMLQMKALELNGMSAGVKAALKKD